MVDDISTLTACISLCCKRAGHLIGSNKLFRPLVKLKHATLYITSKNICLPGEDFMILRLSEFTGQEVGL
jgi:hypothetical protein